MKTKAQKGFTLIELMVTVIIAIVLLLAAGTVLFVAQVSWNNAWKKVNLQRDSSYAMLKMSHSIKAGSSARVEGDGKAVRIYRGTDWIRFFLVTGTKDLKYQIKGKPETLIGDKVEALEFNVQGNKVGIDLKLKEDNLQTHLVSTVMMRNYGG